MQLYSENENYKLYHGNMLDMLEVIEPNSIDSIITDPPYELNFMNRSWDNSGIAFNKDAWKKCYDVIKPGGYLLAFGGSRTFHRIAVAIEDAGFEIRDTIMYLYGSGFPKSLNIGLAIDKKMGIDNRTGNIRTDGKATLGSIYEWANGNPNTKEYEERKAQNQWDGWETQLKPSYEPIIVARKPVEKSIVDNVLKYGVGGINIDECRVEPTGEDLGRNNKVCPYSSERTMGVSNTPAIDSTGRYCGRFPSNVILTYDETDEQEVCGGMPNTKSQIGTFSNDRFKKWKEQDGNKRNTDGGTTDFGYQDEGSASRYFYCAKASKFDRDEGLDEFEEKKGIRINAPRENEEIKTKPRKNIHPTCKPCDLMRYLVRLVSPKGATILDCFNGSGSTGKAVMLENKQYNKNYKYIGIELTEEYLPIAKARIEYICNNNFDFTTDENGRSRHEVIKKDDRLTIFDFDVEEI